MLAVAPTTRFINPIRAMGIASVFFLGFYIGVLFFVGAFAATIVAMTYFRGKFKLMVGFGGGFFGLASWFTVLLNHKEQYDRFLAFLARFLSENWAVFVCDSLICSLGAVLFVTALAATHRSSKQLVVMLRTRVSGSKKTDSADEAPQADQNS
jgi:hypothetical protein